MLSFTHVLFDIFQQNAAVLCVSFLRYANTRDRFFIIHSEFMWFTLNVRKQLK